jgi:ATP-binding protein involved in chromosome partitioning
VEANALFFGQIPLSKALRMCGDRGAPIVLANPSSPASVALRDIADRILAQPDSISGLRLPFKPVSRA